MKLLVTGGNGFIGSAFIRRILSNYDYKIFNLDCLTYAANLNSLKQFENNPNYEFIRGNICDNDLIQKLIKEVDYIINFAAESHVDRSFLDEKTFYKTNVEGVLNILDCAKNSKIKKFLQISTDEVYGENLSDVKNSETSALNPMNPYSASKAASDLFCLSFYKTYKKNNCLKFRQFFKSFNRISVGHAWNIVYYCLFVIQNIFNIIYNFVSIFS